MIVQLREPTFRGHQLLFEAHELRAAGPAIVDFRYGEGHRTARARNSGPKSFGFRLRVRDRSTTRVVKRMGEAAAKVTADQPARRGTDKAMMTLADLNQLWPADHNATPWVATPDGSWTRMAGGGVNPDGPSPISLPHKQGRRNAPAGPINLATAFRDSLSH
jgi:hypothetical protein